MEKIKLEIFAISYSQAQTGAYALILGEIEGKRRLPIIIGAFEAQSIAIAIEKMKSSRPLTHDLFKNFADTFDIIIKEVIISKYSEGVFFSKLVCIRGRSEKEIEIDARTSDAIALAVRFNCPVFTYDHIFSAAGMFLEDDNIQAGKVKATKSEVSSSSDKTGDLHSLTMEELKSMMQEAVESENYEKASEIRDEISKRRRKDQ